MKDKMLADILADYLRLVGNDPDRKKRTAAARKLLKMLEEKVGK